MKDVDLEPQNWQSDRDKPREPIFGPAWPIIPGVIFSVAAIVLIADGTIFTRIVGGIVGALIMGMATAFIY